MVWWWPGTGTVDALLDRELVFMFRKSLKDLSEIYAAFMGDSDKLSKDIRMGTGPFLRLRSHVEELSNMNRELGNTFLLEFCP